MNKSVIILRLFVLVILVLANTHFSIAQSANNVENEVNNWFSFKLQKKIKPGFSLFIAPELRFSEFEVDKYLIEIGGKYKLADYLSTQAIYRLTANQKTNIVEYNHRFALDLKGQTNVGNFEPELRIRYSNITDNDGDPNKKFLRYKFLLAYDIPKNKLTPFVSTEVFKQMSIQGAKKVRYGIGAEYKLTKGNYVGLDYKLDYFLDRYKNSHIIGINYKIKI